MPPKDTKGTYKYAGFPPRFAALIVDSFLSVITLGIYSLIMLIMLTSKGETVGKNMAGIKVVKNDQTSKGLGLGTTLLREIVGRFVDWLVFGIGGLYLLIDPKKQALHDKVADTFVVYKKK